MRESLQVLFTFNLRQGVVFVHGPDKVLARHGRVDLGRLYARMTQQHLYGPQIRAVLQKACRASVTETMGIHGLRESGLG